MPINHTEDDIEQLISEQSNQTIPCQKYTDFYQLPVVTIGAYQTFENSVNIEALYYFLPMTWLKLIKLKDARQYKKTYPGYPGAIMEASYNNMRRGLKVRKSFSNSVTICISTSEKNIGIKIFAKTVHIFGSQSLVSVDEGMRELFNNIEYCNNIRNKIRKR